jgi:hypothetical protein
MDYRGARALLLFLLLALNSLYSQTSASSSAFPAHPCETDIDYSKLNFWVGTWDVYDNQDGTLNGTDVVEKILHGCAIVENWREADGSGEGKSLFYYQKATRQWKQVWVTDAGPIKEKRLVEEMKDGGVRFQGEIAHRDGTSHLDRTTLTPLSEGRVHQLIQISRDAGKTWETEFDADYRRRKQNRNQKQKPPI